MSKQYLVLLRGVNVGGRMLSMPALREALEKDGFQNVSSYINSGNVFVDSDLSVDRVAAKVKANIKKHYKMDVEVVVFTKAEWQKVISSAPAWWGKDPEWKHNLIALIKPYDMKKVVAAVGELKPNIEAMEPGQGILYQSLLFKLYGRTTTGKIASLPVYKQMTIRNYNTAQKLLTLFR